MKDIVFTVIWQSPELQQEKLAEGYPDIFSDPSEDGETALHELDRLIAYSLLFAPLDNRKAKTQLKRSFACTNLSIKNQTHSSDTCRDLNRHEQLSDLDFTTIWQAPEFSYTQDENEFSVDMQEPFNLVYEEITNDSFAWLNDFSLASALLDRRGLMFLLKRCYASTNISVKAIIDKNRSYTKAASCLKPKNQNIAELPDQENLENTKAKEANKQDTHHKQTKRKERNEKQLEQCYQKLEDSCKEVETSVEKLEQNTTTVRSITSNIECKLRKLSERFPLDYASKQTEDKLKQSASYSGDGSTLESIQQTLGQVATSITDLHGMMAKIISTIDVKIKESTTADMRPSANEEMFQKQESYLSLFEEIRKLLAKVTTEQQKGKAQNEELFEITAHLKMNVTSLVSQWRSSQEQEEPALYKTLKNLKTEAGDALVSMKKTSEDVLKIAEDIHSLVDFQPIFTNIYERLQSSSSLNEADSRLFSCIGSRSSSQYCSNRETMQELLKKATTAIVEEMHNNDKSTHADPLRTGQQIEELKTQLRQEHLRCTTLQSEVRLLSDEIIRLQNHLLCLRPFRDFRDTNTEELYNKMRDVHDQARRLSQIQDSTMIIPGTSIMS
nr:PREDICTED: dynactin subunit 1-like isoform X1 [Latimeria chalumnae]|eukprot:XP_014344857.1 PREDICTED: dynactin subunit 1-like isoform X1 [Latimeria chalumnae]